MTVDAAAASESTPTGVRMLVVDDDVVICRQMAADLSSAGYPVVTAHGGARSLAQAEETPPDRDRRSGDASVDVRVANQAADRRTAYGAEARPMAASTRVHQVLESVLEVSASSLGRGVTTRSTARPTSWRGSTPRWNADDSIEISVTNSGPLSADDLRPALASSSGCAAGRDAFRGSATRRGLG